ncbi:hypothetical protein BH11MYX2_BH11MYX2_12230 [soil metagenome]
MLDKAGMKRATGWGGKRKGAGRPPKNGFRAGPPHGRRPAFRASQPVHVSFQVVKRVGELRKMDLYGALRKATLTTAKRQDMRIVHVSIQNSHVHLLVEADGRTALSRGVQGFKISAAKWINRALWERGGCKGKLSKGRVFDDRYYSEVIETPRQARNALAYVLNNWRRHREDRGQNAYARIDKFSTAIRFDGWKEHANGVRWSVPADYEELVVWEPRTWLLTTGWRRHGLISYYERPAHALNATTVRRLTREAAAAL